MLFHPTALPGVMVVELERHPDERGFFARTFSTDELVAHGLDARVAQCSLSWNERRGTLRGLHWQAAPHAEAKLVRVTRGEIHDVVVDLRPDSPTYCRHFALTLSAESRNALFVPAGVAHGFLTLVDGCEVAYQMSVAHAPKSARGARWNDPAFGISWPAPVEVIAPRDASWPDFVPAR